MENFQPPYTEPAELASLPTKSPTRDMGKPMLNSYLTHYFNLLVLLYRLFLVHCSQRPFIVYICPLRKVVKPKLVGK